MSLADHWGLRAGAMVADVAAGTGKLTRQLLAAGLRVVAVEPSASMRLECRQALAGVAVTGGSAEALPFADDSLDGITVAQAFHWFSPRLALHEMARVLRPGGVLVLVWNERDNSQEWTRALGQVMHGAGHPPHEPAEQMRPLFDGDPHFTPFSRWTGAHQVEMEASGVIDMVASRSYVRVLQPSDREALLHQVRKIVAPLAEPVLVPYETNAYCARAIPGPCSCSEEVTWSG